MNWNDTTIFKKDRNSNFFIIFKRKMKNNYYQKEVKEPKNKQTDVSQKHLLDSSNAARGKKIFVLFCVINKFSHDFI